MRPSRDELERLWLHAYARSSFNEAHQWLDLLPKMQRDSPEMQAILCAAVVAYARPFSRFRVSPTKEIAPLSGVAPPKQLRDNHRDALDLRNKVIGHKDAMPAKQHTTTPNIVLLHVTPTYFEMHTTTVGSMDESTREALKELCVFFKKHCEKIIRPLTKRNVSEVLKRSPDVYELIVSDAPSEWLRPFRPQRG